MSLIKKNITANFIGSFWMALMSMAFIPVYIKFLGIESWGVIGIFATLQAVMGIFEMGLGAALTRELSRLSIISGKEQEMHNLVRSMEIIYWSIAVLIGVVIITIAHYIAYQWVNPGQLSTQTIEKAILLMGLAIALRWPASLYSGGLIGLQKQVFLNAINIVFSTLTGGGVVLILIFISPTIKAFFLWQIAMSAFNTIILYKFLWRCLPAIKGKPVFQKKLVIGIWKFAVGMGVISILGLIFGQLDKIIIIKFLSLEAFGYYTFASTVAMSLTRIFTPVFYAIYPKLTQLVLINDLDNLKHFYHKSSQLMSVLIIPIALVVTFFSYEIILLWTQNTLTAEETHILVSIIIVGTAINGLMNPPYALQLAYGWTKLSIFSNIVTIIFITPLTYYLVIKYGSVGAASAWLILNIFNSLLVLPIMYRRLLITEKWQWYLYDIGLPILAGLSVVSIGRILFDYNPSPLVTILYIGVILGLTYLITILSASIIRSVAISLLKKIYLFYRKIFRKCIQYVG
jgi:O-antigen/teichoic acid export membrane protein